MAIATGEVNHARVRLEFQPKAGKMQARAAGQGSPGTLGSASVFLAATTFAGPAFLGFGVGEGGHYSVYLLLGAP